MRTILIIADGFASRLSGSRKPISCYKGMINAEEYVPNLKRLVDRRGRNKQIVNILTRLARVCAIILSVVLRSHSTDTDRQI
jgi:hypothetical protein